MRTIDFERQIKRITQLVPEGEDPRGYIQEILLSLLRSNRDLSMGIVGSNTPTEINRRLTTSLLTAEDLHHPSRIAESPEGIVSLYTIEWLLRPSLPLDNGKIETLHQGIWATIPPDILELQSKAVCRIDLTHLGHLGTGFIVGEAEEHYVIVTNAHVIEAALINFWLKEAQLKLKCSFDVECKLFESQYYELDHKYFLHDVYDLGILYLPKTNINYEPPILCISADQPDDFEDLQVGVIGHPSFNTNIDPFPRIFGFGDQFGIKRLSLGFVKGLNQRTWRNKEIDLLLHDCTTLSGSSGSSIFDLKTKKLIALHFGGWPIAKQRVSSSDGDVWASLFEANGAVPLWLLADENSELRFC